MSVGAGDYQRALNDVGLSDIEVIQHATTGSTNDDARALLADKGREHACILVVADEQTKGRGRGGNLWFSPRGSISMTLSVPAVGARMLGVLPLGVGASVVASLRELGACADVKWPNDILVNGLKVAGILCEATLLGGTARVYIGIGINVETEAEDQGLRATATSLGAHGIRVDRPALVGQITARVLELVRAQADNAAIVAAWKAVSTPWWGEQVSLRDGGVERCVTLLDVNPDGQLVVRDEAGVVRSLVAGEVQQLRRVNARPPLPS